MNAVLRANSRGFARSLHLPMTRCERASVAHPPLSIAPSGTTSNVADREQSKALAHVDPHLGRAVVRSDRIALVPDPENLRTQRPRRNEFPDQIGADFVEVVPASQEDG